MRQTEASGEKAEGDRVIRMKILQMVDYFGSFGGLERFIYNFSRKLINDGYDTLITALEAEEADWGEGHVPVVHVGAVEHWEDCIRRYAPDLIVWHAGPQSAAVLKSLSVNCPVIATVHGPVCPSGGRLFRDKDEICSKPGGMACLALWYMRKCGTNMNPRTAVQGLLHYNTMIEALRSCSKVYTVSNSLKEFLVIDGVPESKITIFDNTLGTLANHFPPLTPAKPGGGEIRLLFIGRLVYNKGVQYFLRSIQLLQKRGLQATGTVVGEGWYLERLRRLARELGIENSVVFAGKVSGQEVNEWYNKSDVVVVPSIWPEPAGLVVPEARASGKPVVVFDAGGLPEWSQWLDGIYVSRAADAEHLADTIVLAGANLRQGNGGKEAATVPGMDGVGALHRVDIIEELHSAVENPA